MARALVTGSSGLIGSEAVAHLDCLGWEVHGIDNNMRWAFFGPEGDTNPNLVRLSAAHPRFTHHNLDIRDRPGVTALLRSRAFDLVIHCAAQPSHDLAAQMPLEDFDINASGTLNVLEATRLSNPDATFVFMSTNKVYGDAPNDLALVELPTRWDFDSPQLRDGIDESCRIDGSLHSLFGASKVAADVLTQEYGRYYGMRTGIFRGGCMTGPNHAGVELHGFLSHLVKVATRDDEYVVAGYKGKQVRDQIHSADVVTAICAFAEDPRPGEVYNIGGGRGNSASILECFDLLEERLGRAVRWRYDERARRGDHICYISDMSKFRRHYPRWEITHSLSTIVDDLLAAELRAATI